VAVPVIEDPITSEHRRVLREAVLLAGADRRRRVPPVLHVGVPGATTVSIADDVSWDHGLRTEIVGAALRAGGDPPWIWVTRAGPLSFQDVDAAWLGPSLAAAAEREVDVAFVVVTRHGWTDPRSGAGRQWKRLRDRGRAKPSPHAEPSPHGA
jgi:hypothetical protein